MKAIFSFGVGISLLTVLVLLLALTNFNPQIASVPVTGAASISQQATPLPEGVSEIGSTDGILVMGIVITLIVTIPLLFRRPKK